MNQKLNIMGIDGVFVNDAEILFQKNRNLAFCDTRRKYLNRLNIFYSPYKQTYSARLSKVNYILCCIPPLYQKSLGKKTCPCLILVRCPHS